MRKLTEEEKKIEARVSGIANKLVDVLNADIEAGGDVDDHLPALVLCTVGVAIRLGVDHKTFLERMDLSYQVMEKGIHVDLVELQPGDKNAHH